MASVHETTAVSVTLEADTLAPLFLPLLDLSKGTQLLPSQCTLTVTGVPSPLECALMLCVGGTEVGTPAPEAILRTGDTFSLVAGEPTALQGGNVPPLDEGGTLGLFVPVQTLTAGATVAGTISTVR